MSYTVSDFSHPSSDGKHTLRGKIYCPDGEIKGYFQVVHGMSEHIGRYDKFMKKMAEEGYITFGYDHLGHGSTATDKSELGYIAKNKGYVHLVDDVKQFADAVIEKYRSEKRISAPYILMGHSMGSFVVRLATAKYKMPDKLIIMGTGGKNPLATPGLVVISLVKTFSGGKRVSQFVEKLAFGTYNDKFEASAQDPSPWLSTDAENRRKYYEDDYSGFKFTVSAMKDLVKMNKDCNLERWYNEFPSSLPTLLVAGKDDPVGNYSAGVLEVKEGLKKRGVPSKCIIYDGARHEILQDFTYDEVVDDILEFLN